MSLNKITTALLVALLVLPFGYVYLWPQGAMLQGPAEPTIRSILFNWAVWLYALPTYALSAILITRSREFTRRAKTLWLIFTFLLFPVAIWVMLGRMYWNGQSQVPKDLEDQRRVLRENVERIKRSEGDS